MATTPGPTEEKARQTARRLLRLFLNDTPELNRLTRKYESDDPQLDLAIQLAVDDYNMSPPLLGNVQVSNYPSLFLLMYGSTIQVLRSQGILQSRNELAYSSGGVSVRIFDKTQNYQSWISQFVAEYERKKQNYKIAANIAGALGGGVSSEYSIISYFW